jgi:alkanesulfonate monooxygenase SsuD/methylene tetrahydromethanopterin reductase-like flavin-dependent oxidoreductase (luciferase family)
MGIPLYAPGERIRRLDEACEIYKRLLTEPTVDFDGRYYQLKEARSAPKPVQKPYPPIVIGGVGEQLTLRVTAKHADIWNFSGADVETFQHKVNVLREHCAAIGRDPAEIALSYQHRLSYDDLPGSVETLKRFIEAGAGHFVIILPVPYPANVAALIAEEVIEKARA